MSLSELLKQVNLLPHPVAYAVVIDRRCHPGGCYLLAVSDARRGGLCRVACPLASFHPSLLSDAAGVSLDIAHLWFLNTAWCVLHSLPSVNQHSCCFQWFFFLFVPIYLLCQPSCPRRAQYTPCLCCFAHLSLHSAILKTKVKSRKAREVLFSSMSPFCSPTCTSNSTFPETNWLSLPTRLYFTVFLIIKNVYY